MEGIIPICILVAIKLFGYRYAGGLLNQRYEMHRSVNSFAALRTFLGVLFGFFVVASANSVDARNPVSIILILLLPFRLLEWALAIYLFYVHYQEKIEWRRFATYCLIGVIWSYVLDIPALAMSIGGAMLISQRGFWC